MPRRPFLGLATSALVVLAAGGCTLSSTSGSEPSTLAAGSPWLGVLAAVALPVPVNSLTAVDCPTDTACWAVGSTVGGAGAPNGAAIIATTNGGGTWSSQVIPPTAGYLSGISCRDQRDCVAVGQAAQSSNGQAVILTTTDAGRSWLSRPLPAGFLDLTAVSCRVDRRCIAIGDVAGGAAALTAASLSSAWTPRGMLPVSVNGATEVSCTDNLHCWVTARRAPDADHVAGVVALTTDGGTTWATAATPPGIGYLTGISCLGGESALPFGSTTPTSAGGTPPATASTAPTTSTAPGSAPPTSAPAAGVPGTHCTAVGTTSTTLNAARTGHGVILTSGNGGGTWSNQPVPASSAALMDVSCTGVGACVLVGSSVSTSAQAGSVILTGRTESPWKSAALVGAPQPLTAVSCVSASRCVVVGESISEHLVGG
jgi:hypothetical protein